MSRELMQLMQQISRERHIDINILIEAIESALVSASKKRFDTDENLTAHFDHKSGEINLFKVFEIVENVDDPKTQIDIKTALKQYPDSTIGSFVEVKEEMQDLGRIAAQTAKHVILQKVREAELENIYNEYKDKKGKLVNGTFMHREKGNVIIDLGKTQLAISEKDIIPNETFKKGERLRAYIVDVIKDSNKTAQIILSRAHPGFVSKLFELEVPEISEGLVTIKGVVREPGERTKIAVYSKSKDVDPVGACVGVRGSRVQSIVRELKGEKIDIIRWSDDLSVFIQNALSPAEITDIEFFKKEKIVKIVVPDKYLSLVIGKRGQNVKLASKLTGWKIDIKSESDSQQETRMEKIMIEQARNDLTSVPGIGPSVAAKLLDLGIRSIKELAKTELKIITSIPGIGKVKAKQILKNAEDLLNKPHLGEGL